MAKEFTSYRIAHKSAEHVANMNPRENWKRSDRYHNSFLIGKDEVLEKVLQNCHENDLPVIEVSAAQGKFMSLLVKAIGGKKIIEVGTLGGYSTIWLARALPDDGQVLSFEVNEKYAKVAADNIALAGQSHKVKIVLGPASEGLAALPSERIFDAAFIDADKLSNALYFQECRRLVRKGGFIIVDNVVRDGATADLNYTDELVEGARALLPVVQADKGVDATTIATVGEHGHDGFVYAQVLE